MDRVKLETIINNVKGIQENVVEIKGILLSKKKQIISDRMIALITMIIAAIALVVSLRAMSTSNKLATNNSALNFTYENIYTKSIIDDTFTITAGIDKDTKGVLTIYIDTKVISGQIRSLYIISKKNDEFMF